MGFDHVIMYLSLSYSNIENFRDVMFFSYLSIDSFISHRPTCDVFTIFISFLTLILLHFVCYFQTALVQTTSKSCRMASETLSACKLNVLPNRKFAGFFVRNVGASFFANCNVSG